MYLRGIFPYSLHVQIFFLTFIESIDFVKRNEKGIARWIKIWFRHNNKIGIIYQTELTEFVK